MVCACYSVEFVPVPDYPNLRRPVAGEPVEIGYERPAGKYIELGVARIRDVDDPRSEGFREFVAAQARQRGASGAWIRLDQTRVVPHNTFGSWFNPGGGIRVVPVVLFDRPAPDS
jgi:hypothetical protein